LQKNKKIAVGKLFVRNERTKKILPFKNTPHNCEENEIIKEYG
jgi:hypothetical protein